MKRSVTRRVSDLTDRDMTSEPPADLDGVSSMSRRPARAIQRENESLRRLVAVSNHLSRLAVQGADLETITMVLARTTGRTVAVLDPLLEPLAVAAGIEGREPDIGWVGRDPQLVRVLGAVAETREALRIPAGSHPDRPGCVIAPILFGDEVFAYLITVEDGAEETSDFDLLVIEHAASAYAIGMARNRGNDRIPTDLTKLIESSLVLLEREMQKYRIQIVTQFEPAPLAFVCGIVYDKDASRDALALLGSPNETLLRTAGCEGLRDPHLGSTAATLIRLSTEGASRLPANYLSLKDRDRAAAWLAGRVS